MAGMMRLQTEAATMTPAAKPVRLRWSCRFMAPFRKKTIALPMQVPRKGIITAEMTCMFIEIPPWELCFYYSMDE